MPEFNELIPIIFQMLPHMLAIFDRPAMRARRQRLPRRTRPPVATPVMSTAVGITGVLELVHGMPPGAVLRYEAPDGTVLTCWSAPGTEHGEYRLW